MTNEEIAVKFENHEQEIKSLKHRMKACEEEQSVLHKLATSVDALAIHMEHMATEQKKQGEHIERLENEPKEDFKHYKRLVIGCVATTVVGAVLGAVLTTIL